MPAYALAALSGALSLRTNRWLGPTAGLLALASAQVARIVLASVVARPRPPTEDRAWSAGGWSTPSGHTTTSMVVAVLLTYAVHRTARNRWRPVLLTLPVVWAVAVGVSRVFLGMHWPTDVLAGWLLAGCWAGLWAADQMGRHKRDEDDTTVKDAMLVGSSQILALLFPGFSRSGATMSTGLILDLDRLAATRLSFFLGIPALTGAGLYELKDAIGAGAALAPLVVGTVVSFAVAYASIAWLLMFVAKHTFNAFVIYRIVIGGLQFALLGTGALRA